MPIPAATPTRNLESRYFCFNMRVVGSRIVPGPSQRHWGDRRCQTGHGCADSVEHSTETTGAFATVTVHGEVGKETSEEATDREGGCDDGEGHIGHGDACREAIECAGYRFLAGEDCLKLVERGDVVAVLVKSKKRSFGKKRNSPGRRARRPKRRLTRHSE